MKPIVLQLVAAALFGVALGMPDFSSKVDPKLLKKASPSQNMGNVIVSFTESTEGVLQAIDSTRYNTREDRLNALTTALKGLAERVQVGALTVLQQHGHTDYTVLWLTNQLILRRPSPSLLSDIASLISVSSVEEEFFVELEAVVEGPILKGRQNPEGEWGVKKVQAAEARDLLRNATALTAAASQVVVATIDTGVRYTHEALRSNWMGLYGWFDPYDGNALPMDINGHGTHTTGTICGAGGIGVFPDAKWTACRGCATSSCAQTALLACAQFIVCPTLPNGQSPDCSKAPHLVSNSWGGGRGQTWFDAAIAAFHVAKIIPLFSIGNSGPSCNTANSPGDRDVIGVGSTTDKDELSSFSSVGPTIDGRMKPDISAPGSSVISAYNSADNDYRALSGTSMACPHAAGLTAFLLAYNPNLDYAGVVSHMKGGAETGLVSAGRMCEGVPDTRFPNYHHGSGRINCFNSLKRLIESSSN